MKKKIETTLDKSLISKAKQIAVSQKQPLNQLFTDALKMYLHSIDKIADLLRGIRDCNENTGNPQTT